MALTVTMCVAGSGLAWLAFAGGRGDGYEPISGSVILTPQCPTPDMSDWANAPISGKPAFTDAVDLDDKLAKESYDLFVEVAAVHRSAVDCGSPIVLKSVGPSSDSAVDLVGVATRPQREADCKAPLRQPEQRVWPLPQPRDGQAIPAYFCVYSTSMRDYSVTAWLDRHQEVHLDFKELTQGRFIIK